MAKNMERENKDHEEEESTNRKEAAKKENGAKIFCAKLVEILKALMPCGVLAIVAFIDWATLPPLAVSFRHSAFPIVSLILASSKCLCYGKHKGRVCCYLLATVILVTLNWFVLTYTVLHFPFKKLSVANVTEENEPMKYFILLAFNVTPRIASVAAAAEKTATSLVRALSC